MKKITKAAALSYDLEGDSAPRVVAGGRGYIAERILEIAQKNDIPVVEDEKAAEILCTTAPGSEIPEIMYQAVAEIYAFIFAAQKGEEILKKK
jgi:flagellar biosynthesis protein